MGWAEGLQGAGAWFAGQGPQYEAAKSLQQRNEQEDAVLRDERRRKAMIQDYTMIGAYADQGQWDKAQELVLNRLDMIQRLGGNPKDTLALYEAIADPARRPEAKAELDAFRQAGIATGEIKAPSGTGSKYSGIFTTADNQRAGLNNETGMVELLPSQGGISARAPVAAQQPASLQEMAWLNNPQRTPEELDMYWRNKRAEQIVASGGGGQLSVSPSGQQTVVVAPEDAIARETTKASSVSEATTRAAEEAKVAVKKETSAPVDLATGTELVRLLNMAITHPGRAAATGTSSAFNKVAVPGSERKDFLVLADQLKGNAFLQAYSSLKGGGPITDIEGQKATEAQNRLNEAQSEGEYKKALEEMRTLTEARNKRIEAYIEKSPKTVVRRGTDKATGKRVVMYSDGTVEPE